MASRRFLSLMGFLVGACCFGTTNEDLTRSMQKIQSELKKIESAKEAFLKINYERARRDLHNFRNAPNPQEKFEAATMLALTKGKLVASKVPSEFTDEELKTLNEGQYYVAKLQAQAQQFESQLTPEQINYITQDNPASLFRTLKRVFLATDLPCTAEDYVALKAKMGAQELAKNGQSIMVLSSQYENKFHKKYVGRALELLRQANFPSSTPELIAYYTVSEKVYHVMPDSDSRIAKEEKKLISNGIAANNVRKYVADKALLSPQCLGRLNIPFVEAQRMDITLDRGAYLLSELEKHIVSTKTRPTDLRSIRLQEGHPIYGSDKDAYGSPYLVEYAGNSVTLKSLGKERDPSPNNIVIGTVALP